MLKNQEKKVPLVLAVYCPTLTYLVAIATITSDEEENTLIKSGVNNDSEMC